MIESVARGRFMLPLIAAFAILGVAVTEATYRVAHRTLDRGIALTDARITSAAVLQGISDLEMATRLHLITGQREGAEHAHVIAQALKKTQAEAYALVARVDTEGVISMDKVTSRIAERLETFASWMRMAAGGNREQALSASLTGANDVARQELRAEFDDVLERARSLQETARVNLYDTLLLNRLAIHLLIALFVVALLLFTRKLRETDRLRADKERQLAVQVAERTSELRELAGYLVSVREEERGRLARELHDELGGLLTAMKLELARLRRVDDLPAAARERINGVEKRLNEGIALKRDIIENLRPSSLDQLGLVQALMTLCRSVAESLGVPVRTDFEAVELAKDVELTIYRLVQESLTNISKYAKCTEVRVSLQVVEAGVEISVADDGRGFDFAAVGMGSHGLLGMRVRVEALSGRLSVDSAVGRGTVVTAFLPTPPAAEVVPPVAPAADIAEVL